MTDKKRDMPYVDRPEVSETFADSLNGVMVDNFNFRIEFAIKRALMTPGGPPRMKKYTAGRVVITHECAVELCNTLNNMLSAMQMPIKPDIKFN